MDVPGDVDFDALLASVTGSGSAKAKAADAWALMWANMLQVPKFVGLGDHWPITAAQAKQLGAATDALAASMPKRRRDALAKALEKTVPGVVFAVTVATIVGPRAMTTYVDMQAKAAQRKERARLREGLGTGVEGRSVDGERRGAPGPGGFPVGPGPDGGSDAARNDDRAVGRDGAPTGPRYGDDPPGVTREDSWPVGL